MIGNEHLSELLNDPELKEMPKFKADKGNKLSAGWLIEHAGMPRGTRVGNVGLSDRHALAIVCHNGATSEEVTAFARQVQLKVKKRFGIALKPEPTFWGFDDDAKLTEFEN